VKIYLFDPETGVYLGEDFADESPAAQGAVVIPPDATDIGPPQAEHGNIPLFNARLQRWEFCESPASARKSLYDKIAGERT